MSIVGGPIDPGSARFQTIATQSMASRIADVKGQDELKPGDEPHAEAPTLDPADVVAMASAETVTADEGMEAAGASGTLSELADDEVETADEHAGHEAALKEEELKKNQQRRRLRPAPPGTAASPHMQNTAHTHKKVESDPAQADALAEKIEGIHRDVPDPILTAAAEIVQHQMVDDNRPSPALANLRSVEGTAEIAPPEGSLTVLGIHDTHNAAVPLELDAEASVDVAPLRDDPSGVASEGVPAVQATTGQEQALATTPAPQPPPSSTPAGVRAALPYRPMPKLLEQMSLPKPESKVLDRDANPIDEPSTADTPDPTA